MATPRPDTLRGAHKANRGHHCLDRPGHRTYSLKLLIIIIIILLLLLLELVLNRVVVAYKEPIPCPMSPPKRLSFTSSKVTSELEQARDSNL